MFIVLWSCGKVNIAIANSHSNSSNTPPNSHSMALPQIPRAPLTPSRRPEVVATLHSPEIPKLCQLQVLKMGEKHVDMMTRSGVDSKVFLKVMEVGARHIATFAAFQVEAFLSWSLNYRTHAMADQLIKTQLAHIGSKKHGISEELIQPRLLEKARDLQAARP